MKPTCIRANNYTASSLLYRQAPPRKEAEYDGRGTMVHDSHLEYVFLVHNAFAYCQDEIYKKTASINQSFLWLFDKIIL